MADRSYHHAGTMASQEFTMWVACSFTLWNDRLASVSKNPTCLVLVLWQDPLFCCLSFLSFCQLLFFPLLILRSLKQCKKKLNYEGLSVTFNKEKWWLSVQRTFKLLFFPLLILKQCKKKLNYEGLSVTFNKEKWWLSVQRTFKKNYLSTPFFPSSYFEITETMQKEVKLWRSVSHI